MTQLLATAPPRAHHLFNGVWDGFKVLLLTIVHAFTRNNLGTPYHIGYIIGMLLFLLLVVVIINRAID